MSRSFGEWNYVYIVFKDLANMRKYNAKVKKYVLYMK